MTEDKLTQGGILSAMADTAVDIVTHDRNAQYGEPEDSFRTIAALWTGYLDARQYNPNEEPLEPEDVARMMELLKMARRMTADNPSKDSFVDAIGYLLCEAKMPGGPAA